MNSNNNSETLGHEPFPLTQKMQLRITINVLTILTNYKTTKMTTNK